MLVERTRASCCKRILSKQSAIYFCLMRRSGRTKKAKQSVKTAAKPAKSEQPATKTPQYFRFLDLSPELRNRVYDYANEDDSRNYALRPRPILPNSPRKSHSERPWKFFALTQITNSVVRKVHVHKDPPKDEHEPIA
ncbi:uncharacterized protein J4E92_008713 [Alternaria infectoria]|uniref:uncharacterized protein n=1 Tax=Alternaria infectoria TaxID=45303 RepID=UPI0022205023|nr:uncharacterized protein J4E92_008713 [Alternaria infectoria]KAI4919069.1 hypothetical protein J4E92_008713 [Alternaria infectoria]